jgi:uncharacterized protein (DUF1778 family)
MKIEPNTPKRKLVNLKYPVHSLALLDKAVKLHPNTDRTKYILDVVMPAVENDLFNRKDFFLNEKDFQAFQDILHSPPRNIETLKALFKEKAPWEK